MLFWEAKNYFALMLHDLFFIRQAQTFVNDGFIDAIKAYDDKDSSLDKAVDDLQKDVSNCFTLQALLTDKGLREKLSYVPPKYRPNFLLSQMSCQISWIWRKMLILNLMYFGQFWGKFWNYSIFVVKSVEVFVFWSAIYWWWQEVHRTLNKKLAIPCIWIFIFRLAQLCIMYCS